MVKQKGSAQVIILVLLIALAGIIYFVYINSTAPKGQLLGPYLPSPVATATSTVSASGSANIEITDWYSVTYPDYFFITYKTYNRFEVADKKFLGNNTHIPTAGITVYKNIIPANMSLTDWLNGIGNPNSPVGNSTPKSCKGFIDILKGQLKYGDLFNGPYPISDCMFEGVSGIKQVTLKGLPALQFQSEAVSSGSTHTILKLVGSSGATSLIDISFTLTGQSGDGDRTEEAYNSFISSIKFNQN